MSTSLGGAGFVVIIIYQAGLIAMFNMKETVQAVLSMFDAYGVNAEVQASAASRR
ncbi:hypothetical protein ACWJJH_15650 [Endozoicomonadaceae bacterium StTr2]